jgi:heat shock protein 4
MSNFRNTVSCLNRFIGKNADDGDLNVEKAFWTCAFTSKNGKPAAHICYRGEEKDFDATELMSMFLGKLKTIAQNETKSAVADCVVSVPVYFNDFQRRAMIDACQIAGLNCLRLLNDTTATALCYGLTKNEMFSEQPRNVCFIDIGFSGTKICIASFTKGNLEIKSNGFDKDLGGRNFDELLADHFSEQLKSKFNVEIRQNARSIIRLRTVCEKIKKVLSGISSTKAELETEDRDFTLEMTREQFEELAGPLLRRLESCLLQAISQSGLALDAIHSVEIVGGSTRIPIVKQTIASITGKEISTTLNQDEAVARGCTFQCAIESPSFRVKEFGVKDIISFPVKFSWNHNGNECKAVEVFPNQSTLPSVKPLFIEKSVPLDIQACYSQPELLPPGTNPLIASFSIKGSKNSYGPNSKTRLDTCISGHGIVEIKKATLIEESVELIGGESADAPKQTKRITREYELNVETVSSSLPSAELQKLKDVEFSYSLSDKYAQELDDSRNALEEYIYDLRSKIEDSLSSFASPKEKDSIPPVLNDCENWLYSDHEAENKELFLNKLAELRKLGDPIFHRFKESEERPKSECSLRQLVLLLLEKIDTVDLEEADQQKIKNECAAKINWLEAQLLAQSQTALYENPKLTVKLINDQREKLLSQTSVIFARAKPKKIDEPAPLCTESNDDSASQNYTESAPNMDID